ncbi:MAG: AMP-binding protein [Planctomycetota bacterium]|jgi:fatty-acyl-CoA synthase|nr:AMP-binding protein [Planctomycetota bacterium]
MTDEIFTELTMGEFLDRQAEKDPDREFIVYPDRDLRFTYRRFNERVDDLASGLLEIGLEPGDHLGIWARNVPDWLTYFFAVAKLGAVPVTINTYYKSHELEYVIRQSDMKALALVDGYKGGNYSYLDILYEIAPEIRETSSFTRRVRSAKLPLLRTLVYMGPEKHRGMYSTNEILSLGAHSPGARERLRAIAKGISNRDMVNMQYTSGTTGYPKGVMLTHRNIINNGFYIGERQKLTEIDRVCIPVPLFHCFGIVLGVMAVLTHGCTAVMLEQFEPLAALAAVEKGGATAIYGVPTMFIAEMTHPLFDKFDLSSLRTGIMSGSPCPIEWMEKAINLMHMRDITIPYGMTETGPVFTMTSVDDTIERKVSTVGTAMPHSEVRVIDPETGLDCPPNVPGELCCRGYNVMKGYYKMPEETAKAIDRDGFMHSGDLGSVDEHGYYRITGRLKDMIIRGGENIYPRELEEFLYKYPGVKDVQVVGAPDPRFGEAVAAFVILHPNVRVAPEDIQDFARAKIAPYKVPKYVWFIDALPLTTSGKVQKYILRQMAAERIKAAEEAGHRRE